MEWPVPSDGPEPPDDLFFWIVGKIFLSEDLPLVIPVLWETH